MSLSPVPPTSPPSDFTCLRKAPVRRQLVSRKMFLCRAGIILLKPKIWVRLRGQRRARLWGDLEQRIDLRYKPGFAFHSEEAVCPLDSLHSTQGYHRKLTARLKLPYLQHEALHRFCTSTESPSGFGSNSQIISYRVYASTCIFHLLLLLVFFGICRSGCK